MRSIILICEALYYMRSIILICEALLYAKHYTYMRSMVIGPINVARKLATDTNEPE